ncbi:phosphoprotein [New Kent County virus]|uniref:Phosphoprotein n=1 Tax=New Kent County virus TaxID=2079603 RepID=A0A2K9YNH5_9RHAB|nr:phosphoprotein [New Kent County virus]AUW34397.1 phosphoprotein [New Kent County virus]
MERNELKSVLGGYDMSKLKDILTEVEDDDSVPAPEAPPPSFHNPLFDKNPENDSEEDNDKEWGDIVMGLSNEMKRVDQMIDEAAMQNAKKTEVIKKKELPFTPPLLWDNHVVFKCENVAYEMSKLHSVLSLFNLVETKDYSFTISGNSLTINNIRMCDDEKSDYEPGSVSIANYDQSDLSDIDEADIKAKMRNKLDEGIRLKKINGKGYTKISWFTKGIYQTILDDIDWTHIYTDQEGIVQILKQAKLYKLIKKTCEL